MTLQILQVTQKNACENQQSDLYDSYVVQILKTDSVFTKILRVLKSIEIQINPLQSVDLVNSQFILFPSYLNDHALDCDNSDDNRIETIGTSVLVYVVPSYIGNS